MTTAKEQALNQIKETDWAAKKCENCKRDMIVLVNSLTGRQYMKLWLLHERNRHLADIERIDNDLTNLVDVELPEGIPVDAWFDV